MSSVFGTSEPAFQKVKDVFEANFSEDAAFQEAGAALAVYHKGQLVVDLWGGQASDDPATAFATDTLVHGFSTGKGIPALAIAQLFDKGLLNYDDPVAKFWPEFAQAGKDNVTIAHVMSHQSGVNAFDEPIGMDEFGDWDAVVARLAAQAPAWVAGEETAYHAVTYGHLAMEVVRRITGLSPAEYVQKHIAEPVGADVYVGAPQSEWSRIAKLVPPPPPAGRPEMNPMAIKAIMNPMIIPPMTAMPAWRSAEVPAVNCHLNAKGLAKVWNAVAQAGKGTGVELLSPTAVAAMSAAFSTRPDLLMGNVIWGAGILRNNSDQLLGPDENTVGNIGFGGSFSIANPSLDVAAAYTPNKLFPDLLRDPRAIALRVAITECAKNA